MILSASRRTDIPAFYTDWFFHRLSEGYVVTRNPMNGVEKRVSLLPEDVDGIVFWSKNPAPMLGRLHELARYRYYFQFTLTPYGKDIEPGIPDKNELLETFRRLSEAIGAKRVIWRYDPILINPDYKHEYHINRFAGMAHALRGLTRQCTISFIDAYRSTKANSQTLKLTSMSQDDMRSLARSFADAAAENGIATDACAEETDLADCGVGRARCVDASLFNSIWGMDLPTKKASGQRSACGCTQSTDIGAYNTCPGGCLYCYANYNSGIIARNIALIYGNSL